MKNNKVTKPMKLLTYLKEERNFSQDKAEKLLKAGRVLVNDDVCTSPDLMLKKDDEVKIKKNKKLIAGAAIPLTALAVAGAIGGAASVIPVVNNTLMVINVACANGFTWKDTGSSETKQVKVKKDSTLSDNRDLLSGFEVAEGNGKIAWTDSPDPQTSQTLNSQTVLQDNQTIYAVAGADINYSAGEGHIVSGSAVETVKIGTTFGQVAKPTVEKSSIGDERFYFDGWRDEDGQPVNDNTIITNNLNLTAAYVSQWDDDKWFLQFTNGGDIDIHFIGNTYVAVDKGKPLYTANKPYPWKTGYKFVRWLYEVSPGTWNPISEDAIVNSNLTIKPEMEAEQVTKVATFNPDGGSLEQGSLTVTFVKGTKFGDLPTPTFKKGGYIFDHWGASQGAEDPIDPTTVLNDDITVWACWTQITALTATFTAEAPETGATITWDGPTTIAYDLGTTFANINKPHPTVATTTGHSYEVDNYYMQGSSTPIDPTQPLPSSSCTIRVTFTLLTGKHTLTYNANQGTFPAGEVTSVDFTDNTAFGNYHQPAVTREGYVFTGWYTQQEGGTQFLNTTLLTEDTKIAYAHWAPVAEVHTINFTDTAVDSSGAVLEGSAILEGPTTFGYSGTITWTSVTCPTPWYFPASIETTYMFSKFQYSTDGTNWSDVTDSTTFTDQDVEIRSVFTSSTAYITIQYNANGGQFGDDEEVEYRNVPVNSTFGDLIKPTATRDGYVFTGWFTESSGGTQIEDTYVFTATTRIYAHWEIAPAVKVMTFSNNGDTSIVIHGSTTSFEPGTTGVKFGDMTVPLAEKVGFEFDCWCIQESPEYSKDTPVTWNTVFKENATVYPKFKEPYIKASRYYHQDDSGTWWMYDSQTLCNADPTVNIVRYKVGEPTVTQSIARTLFNEKIYIGSGLENIAPNFLCGCTAFNDDIIFTSDCEIQFIYKGFMQGCTSFNKDLDMRPLSKLEYIGDNFLENCTSFNGAIKFSQATKQLGTGFLYGCTSFNNGNTSGTLDNPFALGNVEIIGEQFLMNCTSFHQEIGISTKITSIGEFFMHNCDSFGEGSDPACLILQDGLNVNEVFKGYDGTFSSDSQFAPSFCVRCSDAQWDVIEVRFPNLTGQGPTKFYRTMVRLV